MILLAIAISTLVWGDLTNHYVWVVLLVTLGFGAIGWVDDYRKVVEKNPRGLPARWKYFWQSVVGIGAAVVLYATATTPAETSLLIPMFKDVALPLGVFYIVLSYFVIVGSSNAVNLTDGLDGLAIMPTVLVAMGLSVFAYASGNAVFANYLHIPFIHGTGELAVFLRHHRGRWSWLSVVQHVSRPSVHGGMSVPWRWARRSAWWRSSFVKRSCCSSWAVFSCWKPSP